MVVMVGNFDIPNHASSWRVKPLPSKTLTLSVMRWGVAKR